MKHVAVIGSATIDHIHHNGCKTIKAGGVVIYSGITYKKFGLRTTIITNISSLHDSLVRIFLRHDLELLRGDTQDTTQFINHVEGENRWQEMPCSASPINAKQVYGALKEIDLIHLGPLHPGDFEENVLEMLMDSTSLVSLDAQGYVRRISNDGRVHFGISKLLYKALAVSSIVKVGRSELEVILKELNMTIHEFVSSHNIDELVVTSGSEGGRVITAEGEDISYQAHMVNHVLDTTGAGDVFFASYLVSRLKMNQSIANSCEHSAKVAAHHVEGMFISPDSLRIHIDDV